MNFRTALVTDALVEVLEEVVPPGDESQLVDLVDSLPALLALPADPVPVEVGAHTVQDLGSELVFLPLSGVEPQHGLVHQLSPVLNKKKFINSAGRTG